MKKTWKEWKLSDGDYIGDYKEPQNSSPHINMKENLFINILLAIFISIIFALGLSFLWEI